jgi:CheY-like chemotaxis protein
MDKKILIVDDVPGWIRFHKNNLEYLGINGLKIDSAQSAREGIEKVEASIDTPYSVIFTDLQMESDFLPKFAGEWFIEQVKTYSKYYKDTKIVIVSASPNIADIAKRHGVLFLPKTVARNSDSEVYRKFVEN